MPGGLFRAVRRGSGAVARRRARAGQHGLQGLVRAGLDLGLLEETTLRSLGDWPVEVFANLNTPEDVARLP